MSNDWIARAQDILNQRGISSRQLSAKLGLSNSAFTDWKKGKGVPSLSTIVKIAEFLDVSIDYLVYGTGSSPQDVLEYSNTDDAKLLIKFHSLPPEMQGKVFAYIDGMLAALSVSVSGEDECDGEKRLSS